MHDSTGRPQLGLAIYLVLAGILVAPTACGGAAATEDASDVDRSDPDTADAADTSERDSSMQDTSAVDTLSQDTTGPDALDQDADDAGGEDTGGRDAAGEDAGGQDIVIPTTVGMSCGSAADCRLPCGDGDCVGGRCSFEGRVDACVMVDPSTDVARCVAALSTAADSGCLFCNPHVSVSGFTSVIFETDFEANNPLSVEHLGDNAATWRRSGSRAAGGQLSLYFGDIEGATYGLDGRSAARATTAPLSWPEGAAESAGDLVLTFELWLETEQTRGFDFLRVLLVAEEMEDQEIWHSDSIGGTTFGAFLPMNIPLPAGVAPGARLSFEFDSVDGIINSYEGAYLDAIRLATQCCSDDVACDDANPCTTQVCDDGQCIFSDAADCCLSRNDCDDGDVCTVNLCSEAGGSCDFEAIFDCCHETSDCDDSDPCTEDRCAGEGAICTHQPLCCDNDGDCGDGDSCTLGTCDDGQCSYVFACCAGVEDCDDGDACTADSCTGEVCGHAFQVGPGCCLPEVMTERFDSGVAGGDLAGWTLSAGVSNIGWRVQADSGAPSGGQMLYYGHPALLYYDNGQANGGTVTSPSVRLPDDVEVRLSLKLRLDVEPSAFKDTFEIVADVGSESVTLLTKADVSVGKSWQDVSLDISYLAGQNIRLRFVFDTVDGLANATTGVQIDDVRLLSSCQPRACVTDASCSSKASCIRGTCGEGGGCAYEGVSCGP